LIEFSSKAPLVPEIKISLSELINILRPYFWCQTGSGRPGQEQQMPKDGWILWIQIWWAGAWETMLCGAESHSWMHQCYVGDFLCSLGTRKLQKPAELQKEFVAAESLIDK
jgi:hypothetical protein